MNNPTYRKKLIEVALPLSEINDASAYDKMPGIGPHPKGVHHWWARLPLPSPRAILFASLVDDPSSDPKFADKTEDEQDRERDRLFKIARNLLQKKIHTHPEVFKEAHAEIVRSCEGDLPVVLDPFCGHGAIPLEAQRLGLKTIGSDLNPVAVLITKASIEIIPKFANISPVNPDVRKNQLLQGDWSKAHGLAEDVRYYGSWILEKAKQRISDLYPKVKLPKKYGGTEVNVIAWIWARTVKCSNPTCEAQMPLVHSFSLSTKANKAWIQPLIDKTNRIVRFDIQTGKGRLPKGTKIGRGSKFKCIVCDQPVEDKHIKEEGLNGRMSSKLMAIVAQGNRSRVYLPPSEEHENIALEAEPEWRPEYELGNDKRAIWTPLYGLDTFDKLFTPRQLLALNTFSDLIIECRQKILVDAITSGVKDDGVPLRDGGEGAESYADAITTFLSFTLNRCADFNNSMCGWIPSNQKVMHLFGRQGIPMAWDYAEANILEECVGGWPTCNEYITKCIDVTLIGSEDRGKSLQLDAAKAEIPGSNILCSTDPPYYDNIGYSDISDFFYVWLRRSLGKIFPDLFSTILVPKAPELVAIPYRFDGDKKRAKEHFETGFNSAFSALKGKLDPRFPLTVYYAFKQDEQIDVINGDKTGRITLTTGWETLLQALISTGFQITATWPVRASQEWRMVSMGTNALASYVVLACRPRKEDAPFTTRRDFLTMLKKELVPALRKLQRGSIAPVDFPQCSIGPGMAVFSRYSKILEADGSPMTVRTALALINQALDEFLTEQESEYDSGTRWALAWFEQFAMEEGPYGVAESLSKAKNTAVEALMAANILIARGGKVRLLRRDEFPENWDPAKEKRLTVWEVTHQLLRTLVDQGSEEAAADLLSKIGAFGEAARDLAYRLHSICERRKWAKEALAYNSLVVSWPELVKLAGQQMVTRPTQEELFEKE